MTQTVVSTPAELPVVVIGAGPVGLAVAAHLAEHRLFFLVFEQGSTIATSVGQWGHVRLFSPWRYNIDAAARRLLAEIDWTEPHAESLPTGDEVIADYLKPLAAHGAIAPYLRFDVRVEAISRVGFDRVRTAGRENAPFVVRTRHADGSLVDVFARAIVDASGNWETPNPLGANGLPAPGEVVASEGVTGPLPDVLGRARDRFVGRHTVVVGAGHSATTTLIALAELASQVPATRVTWAIRSAAATRAFGGGEADALVARGALGTRIQQLVEVGTVELVTGFFTNRISKTPSGALSLSSSSPSGETRTLEADLVVNATGFRPDHSIASELRLDLDPILGSTRTLAPLIDPNHHSCGTVPPHGIDELAHAEPGYYAIGVKSYGRAPTFLLATGYEQARSVSAALAGDWDAARDVRLELPETGVCSVTFTESTSATATVEPGCGGGCGTSAVPDPLIVVHCGLGSGIADGLLKDGTLDDSAATVSSSRTG